MNAPLKVPPYNTRMFKWAREWRGRSVQEAAQKVKKTPEVILAWESNKGAPTVNQARQLAEFYDRQFLEFFLPAPPEIVPQKSVPDFRAHVGVAPPHESWEFREILRRCEARV